MWRMSASAFEGRLVRNQVGGRLSKGKAERATDEHGQETMLKPWSELTEDWPDAFKAFLRAGRVLHPCSS